MLTFGYSVQSAPIVAPDPMEHPAPIRVRGPTRLSEPIEACGPIDAEGSTKASRAMTALSCAPGAVAGLGYNAATARAKAARGSCDRITVRPAGKSSGTIRHPACDCSAAATAFRLATKAS